jgi:NAD(P)-dependent dehydrogenase (short-subunit alcohol dehydrogenase family)
MELGLRDKAVLVTGGTRGIGRAIALAFARERARVGITYATDEAAATTVVQQIATEGGSGVAARLDLAEPASIPAAITETAKRFGGLDVLVANAVRWPIDARGPLADSDPDLWSRALRANLEGTAATVRAALAYLSRSSAGRVVLVSSGVSRHGMAGATAYATAKAGLDGLIAALKWEAGEHDVLINIVSPGFTVTENTRELLQRRTGIRSPAHPLATPIGARRHRHRGPVARLTGKRQHHRRIPPGRGRHRLTRRRRPLLLRPVARAWRGGEALSAGAHARGGPRRTRSRIASSGPRNQPSASIHQVSPARS